MCKLYIGFDLAAKTLITVFIFATFLFKYAFPNQPKRKDKRSASAGAANNCFLLVFLCRIMQLFGVANKEWIAKAVHEGHVIHQKNGHINW